MQLGENATIPPDRYIELKSIRALIYKSPDIREDMVYDLKTRILEGFYGVEADKVAEKIIQYGAFIFKTLNG